ncbi:class I SAM-dependent methyltransferase [Acinetobacter junii]|jgi:adenine-specific DNA methylase|uniref:site-specific DNA-methyltransferase (adenine-specific) n=1 Tax=Acinetobacter junii TaxID=40215 RepID=A0AAW5RCA8_ACIJU|nr:class I SAM-dependent methyltransferase [Acinetobacter junii]MCU4398359.1 class I SAM-dependent methyltransferase [Acinetobacter junii]MDH1857877.1 class I SAM-dependent methyltransferase [Acinetobacter junii]MDU2409008.1 class I SAM-dependent methyltransferase [Acinetobacter junii]
MKLIKDASAEKLRGGFYTPEPIAAFILKWGINGSSDYDILEPSCGDGVFLEQLRKKDFCFQSVIAIEFDIIEANKANQIDIANKKVINQDFHLYCNTASQKFDLIVGNPPYIRYQYFDKNQQIEADKIFKKAELKYSKLTNAWVSFIVGSSLLLKEKGKIGFVVPAELLQVSYAQQLREFLAHFYNKINIISFEKLVFPDIQQEVVLLLCEKNSDTTHLIEHLELKDASDLEKLDVNLLKSPRKQIDFKSNKWTYYFLEQEEIDFLENIAERKNIPILGDFADVEVGITTGANSYFTVPISTVKEFNLEQFAKPMVGRSVQVNSITFTESDWLQNLQMEAKANLLVFPNRDQLSNHSGANKYIEYGEELGVNKGYKTRIRDDWFVIPSIKLSDALFIRRNNLFPRLILNEAQAYTTDTMHRVFIKQETNKQAFIASFYNSLSLAFSEIVGRSYGGGVLELMPSEAARILLPYKDSNGELLVEIDKLMRGKRSIDDILSISNDIILRQAYGFSKKEIELADRIWKKLSARRLNRGK